MHELSLCESVLNILKDESKKQGFSEVKHVWLEIGQMASVEREAMMFSFDVVTRNSLADGANLTIIDIPGEAWCMYCEKTIAVNQRFDSCPECGSYQIQVTAGDEMRIKELEVI